MKIKIKELDFKETGVIKNVFSAEISDEIRDKQIQMFTFEYVLKFKIFNGNQQTLECSHFFIPPKKGGRENLLKLSEQYNTFLVVTTSYYENGANPYKVFLTSRIDAGQERFYKDLKLTDVKGKVYYSIDEPKLKKGQKWKKISIDANGNYKASLAENTPDILMAF